METAEHYERLQPCHNKSEPISTLLSAPLKAQINQPQQKRGNIQQRMLPS